MKKRLRYLALVMALTVASTACAGAAEEAAAPAATAEESIAEQAPEAATEATTEEVKEEPAALEEPDNVVEPQFTDDFDEVTDYSQYLEGSTVKSGSRIWVQGKVKEYDKDSKAITVRTKDGDWIVSVGSSGTEDYYKQVEKAVDQFVRIFGVYTGYDADSGKPSMAFQPKDYQKYAFRLESVDNNFRLTQTDYTVSIPEFDQDETFMNITYKMPSVWKKDDSESGHYYRYPEDTLSSFVMYNYIENPDSGFDEINADKILSDLADSYVGEKDQLLRKQPFKLAGYPALCFEMAFTPDGFPIPLTMFCYMFIVDNTYYFYGVTEPYLVGETSKQLLSNLLSDIKVADSSAATKADADTKDKSDAKDASAEASTKDSTTEKKDAASTEKTDSASTGKSTEKADSASAEKSTATDATAANTAAAEPAKTEAEKPAHPPKSEILGHLFTEHIKGSISGEHNGEMVSLEQDEELPTTIFSDAMLANYNEATGTCSYTDNIEGVPTTMNFTFSYDSKGNIVYSTPVNYSTDQYSFTGTISGYRK